MLNETDDTADSSASASADVTAAPEDASSRDGADNGSTPFIGTVDSFGLSTTPAAASARRRLSCGASVKRNSPQYAYET